jgi:hypothetical protein
MVPQPTDPARSPVAAGERIAAWKGRPGSWAAVTPDAVLGRLGPLVEEVRRSTRADAITVVLRQAGAERLLVWNGDGEVREVYGSVSLGLISHGPTRLVGGLGALQAAELASLVGFWPAAYFGALIHKPRLGLTGGLAAWSRTPRRWGPLDGSVLRRMAVGIGGTPLEDGSPRAGRKTPAPPGERSSPGSPGR